MESVKKRNPQGREKFYTYTGICITFAAYALVNIDLISLLGEKIGGRAWGEAVEHFLFMVLVSMLVYGAFVYLFTRLGYLYRLRDHQPVSIDKLEAFFSRFTPSLTILVPSYKEDSRVVEQTLMSAALQNYPNKRVVLLIDDPPDARGVKDVQLLEEARALPGKIQSLLKPLAERFQRELQDFRLRKKESTFSRREELRNLAGLHGEAAEWFLDRISEYEIKNHTDELYVASVLRKSMERHRDKAGEFLMLAEFSENISVRRLEREFKRIASLFQVPIGGFERKGFSNLSHEANKAMNLNSFLGVMGKHLVIEIKGGERSLRETSAKTADVFIPDADYVITLDADSLLLPDYAIRLIHLMEKPQNKKVAVIQTPYSAVPNATNPIERIAGATTDIQYQIHQGFTAFAGTFWVGANALLRKKALEDIAQVSLEKGNTIIRFIQDRTVIEDTESSIDLISRGWTLYNYPEKLAYSATPPDFGSLVIQRRRWANGGLIILPKLLRYLMRGPGRLGKTVEFFFRFHYLFSIAAVNFGLLVLLAYPFAESIQSWWLPMTALPYFIFYARDLRGFGYKTSDIFRVYALNLLLIPVNLGGVIKSIHQGITAQKIPFGRTPKVSNRTSAPPLYILGSFLLTLNWFMAVLFDLASQYWLHAFYAFVNASFLLYAIREYVGFEECGTDVLMGLQERFAKRPVVELPAPRPYAPSSKLVRISNDWER